MFSLWETSIAIVRTEPYRSMPIRICCIAELAMVEFLVLQVNMRANAEIDCVNRLENECVQWLTCHN